MLLGADVLELQRKGGRWNSMDVDKTMRARKTIFRPSLRDYIHWTPKYPTKCFPDGEYDKCDIDVIEMLAEFAKQNFIMCAGASQRERPWWLSTPLTMFRDPVPWAMSNGVQDVLDEKDLKNIQINRSNLGFGKGFLKGQTLTHGFFAKRACYANGLEAWLKVFPRENFLFLTSEDFFADPQATYDQVTDFLGVPRAQYPQDLSNGGSGRRRNNRKHHGGVHEEYHALPWVKDCRERLEKLTGIKVKWDDHSESPSE